MKFTISARLFLIVGIILIAFNTGGAQTIQEAQEAYNEGIRLSKTDVKGAIQAYSNAVELYNKLGESENANKIKATSRIPELWCKIGTDLLKEKKYADAIVALEKAYDVAEELKSTKIKNRCTGYLRQLYYNNGATAYKNNDLTAAMENYNKSIQWDQTYLKAFFGKASIYKKQNDLDNLKQIMTTAKQIAMSKNDTKNAAKADKTVRDYLIQKGVGSFNDNKTKDALTFLEDALYYDENNIETLYWLTSTYNKQGKYDNAITSINKAIGLEKGGDEKSARLYYELGTAYKGKRDTAKACDAFKKAKFGKYIESANYEITEVLKCGK